jgi:autotransporter passenger strand-loop-strand repeat protein
VVNGTVVRYQGQDDVTGSANFTVISGGFESLMNGGRSFDTTVSGGGSQRVQTGGIASGTVLSSGGVMELTSGGIANFTVVSAGGTLRLGSVFQAFNFENEVPAGTASFTQIDNGGSLDLLQLAYQPNGTVTLDPANDMLTVTEGGSSYTQQLSGDYTGLYPRVSSDGFAFPQSGIPAGTIVTFNTTQPCFLAGTRIATPTGQVAVEDLRAGDHVALHGGRVTEIVWMGHRRVDCSRHTAPVLVWPVRVAAGAFGPDQPRRDLFLSPDHAIFAGGMLIPVKHLLNGTTIAQIAMAEAVYFHVELTAHDVLIAEGLTVESYLDTGDRCNFENGGAALALHPDFSARMWQSEGCAPLIVTGPKLKAVRRLLDRRAAKLLSRPASANAAIGQTAANP